MIRHWNDLGLFGYGESRGGTYPHELAENGRLWPFSGHVSPLGHESDSAAVIELNREGLPVPLWEDHLTDQMLEKAGFKPIKIHARGAVPRAEPQPTPAEAAEEERGTGYRDSGWGGGDDVPPMPNAKPIPNEMTTGWDSDALTAYFDRPPKPTVNLGGRPPRTYPPQHRWSGLLPDWPRHPDRRPRSGPDGTPKGDQAWGRLEQVYRGDSLPPGIVAAVSANETYWWAGRWHLARTGDVVKVGRFVPSKEPLPLADCAWCGKVFQPERRPRKGSSGPYCCDACRLAAWRKRLALLKR